MRCSCELLHEWVYIYCELCYLATISLSVFFSAYSAERCVLNGKVKVVLIGSWVRICYVTVTLRIWDRRYQNRDEHADGGCPDGN